MPERSHREGAGSVGAAAVVRSAPNRISRRVIRAPPEAICQSNAAPGVRFVPLGAFDFDERVRRGATAVMRHTKDKPTPMANWIRKLLVKKPFRVVSVALANKLARIAWVVLTRKEAYRPYQLAA